MFYFAKFDLVLKKQPPLRTCLSSTQPLTGVTIFFAWREGELLFCYIAQFSLYSCLSRREIMTINK